MSRIQNHEPRALWSFLHQAGGAQGSETTLLTPNYYLLPKEHFRNGSRHRILVTHVLFAPVGHPFTDAPNSSSRIGGSAGNINDLEVLISAPQKSRFSREPIRMGAFGGMPTSEPELRNDGGDLQYGSGLYGVSRWDFDEDLVLKPDSSVQFDMAAANDSLSLTNPTGPRYSVLFTEEFDSGGWRQAGARLKERTDELNYVDQSSDEGNQFPGGAATVTSSQGETSSGSETRMWPAEGQFSANEWRKQESNRGASSTAVKGFSAHIDQIDRDEEAIAEGGAKVGYYTPLSTSIGCRARTRSGGTGEWWWRPGAPLALVSPTITPAISHRFARPFVLDRGEGLHVEVFIPDFLALATFGVSLCGYALIER